MFMLPKAFYRFNAIPIKIPIVHFTGIEQIFQKFIWNHKRPQITIAILRKKNKIGGITLPDIKLYYKNISHCNIFFWYISLGKGNKRKKINKWHYIKLKSICIAKETIDKMQRQSTEWENIFPKDTFDKVNI